MIRSYVFKHGLSQTKEANVADMVRHWRFAAQKLRDLYLIDFYELGYLNKFMSTRRDVLPFFTELNARQVKAVRDQVFANMKSFQELRYAEVKDRITYSSLSEEDKTVLYRVNAHRAWFKEDFHLEWVVTDSGELIVPDKRVKKNRLLPTIDLPVEKRLMKLSRHMFKSCKTSVPDFSHCSAMKMSLTCIIEDSKTDTFRYWARLNTMGDRIWVPLFDNGYAVEKGGRRMGETTVVVLPDGRVEFHIPFESANAPMREPGGRIIGLDFNISSSLFSSSDGDLYGVKFLRTIRKWDARATERQAWLQKNKLSVKNDAVYQNLLKRMRDYSKNEVNRILNKVVADEDVSELILEKLDFRDGSGDLSPTTNRLLQRVGRKAVKRAIENLREKKGVDVKEFNPAYSSQECHKCHFVVKSNRNGHEFECGHCGLKLHADVNSPRVLVSRRTIQGTDTLAGLTMKQIRSSVRTRGLIPGYARVRTPRVPGSGDSMEYHRI